MSNENECSSCEKSFKTNSALKAHKTRFHDNTVSEAKTENTPVTVETQVSENTEGNGSKKLKEMDQFQPSHGASTINKMPILNTSGRLEDITFFGEVDMNKKGKTGSNLPAWMFPIKIEELRESIASNERELEQKMIPAEKEYEIREELEQQIVRLDQIENSKPKLRGGDKDGIKKLYDRLGEEISTRMFTRTEMMKGFASANEEVRKLQMLSVRFDGELAKKLNLPSFRGGKISGEDCDKAWKILGGALGENTNVEYRRRDRTTASGNFPGVREVLVDTERY